MEAEGVGATYRSAQGGNRKGRKEARANRSGNVGQGVARAAGGPRRIFEKIVSKEARECKSSGCKRNREREGKDRAGGESALSRRPAPASPGGPGPDRQSYV